MEQQKSVLHSTINFNSVSFKIVLIIILIMVMLIPKSEIENLVYERMNRADLVVKEVGEKWGGQQVLDGPILTIPENNLTNNAANIYIAAEELNATVEILPEVRSLGIFSTVVYSSIINLKTRFKVPQMIKGKYDPSRAVIQVGISETVGIGKQISCFIDEKPIDVKSGILVPAHFKNGFHIPLNLTGQKEEFEIILKIKLNGNESLHLAASAKNNLFEMQSTWKDPGFIGDFLPSEREVNDNTGFTASWNINEFQRNAKSVWYENGSDQNFPKVGVKLVQVNDVYQKILRVIKYAILFITFTFAIVFISERLMRISIHPLQYLLTGLASLFFYIFLLSIAEHFTFNTAYLSTSLTVTLLMSLYAKGIFRSNRMAGNMGAISALLYSFLFTTLQIEDYALLMGSTGLLIILAVVMYLTRGINRETTHS